MSQTSINEIAAGKIVNLLSNDVARFDMAFMFLHYLWLVPLQLSVVLYFLYDAGGYAPFVGLFGVVLLVLPIQGINYIDLLLLLLFIIISILYSSLYKTFYFSRIDETYGCN